MLQYPKTKLLFFRSLAYYSSPIKVNIKSNGDNKTPSSITSSNINVTPCIFELQVL